MTASSFLNTSKQPHVHSSHLIGRILRYNSRTAEQPRTEGPASGKQFFLETNYLIIRPWMSKILSTHENFATNSLGRSSQCAFSLQSCNHIYVGDLRMLALIQDGTLHIVPARSELEPPELPRHVSLCCRHRHELHIQP